MQSDFTNFGVSKNKTACSDISIALKVNLHVEPFLPMLQTPQSYLEYRHVRLLASTPYLVTPKGRKMKTLF